MESVGRTERDGDTEDECRRCLAHANMYAQWGWEEEDQLPVEPAGGQNLP